MTARIVETKIKLPVANTVQLPLFEQKDYQARIQLVLDRMKDEGYDVLMVYGDREHFANLFYLTGYDPRFEESLFIIDSDGESILLVGNEGWDYSEVSPLKPKKILYQPFSLQGQPRNSSPSLKSIFEKMGCKSGKKVGVVGTKYFSDMEFDNHRFYSDIPSFIIDEIRLLVGADNVINATAMFVDGETGLRHNLSAKEIALFEAAANNAYIGYYTMLKSLTPGVTEAEVARNVRFDGTLPFSYHLVVSFGRQAELGLASPTDWNRLKIGDYVSINYGIWGANFARSGMALHDSRDLPKEAENILDDFYKPYFLALAKWYEIIAEGVTGGEIYESVRFMVEDKKFGVTLNPGHLIHFDEWTNSIISKNSKKRLSSGVALQCDIIANPGKPYYGVHAEDGVVIAGAELRKKLADEYPETYRRILARRDFMEKNLGIKLDPSVLPMSDIQGVVFPYMLDTSIALRIEK